MTVTQCTTCWALSGAHFAGCEAPEARLRGHGVGMKTTAATPRGDTSSLRRIAYDLAGGACLARHIHHQDCPQHVKNASVNEFVAHHRWPTGKGGGDDPLNLLWVWNDGRMGAGGCHQKIHDHSRVARVLGLLQFTAGDHLFGIGVDRALELGEINESHLTAAEYTP